MPPRYSPSIATLAAAIAAALIGCSGGSLDNPAKIGNDASDVPVPSLKLMSFNIWVGGTNVTDGETKVRDAILAADPDIVAMQESNGVAERLATELGWDFEQAGTNSSVAVLSRYPITQNLGVALHDAGVGVHIELSADPPQSIIVWSAHLTAYPYGPYDACLQHLSASDVLAHQQATQLPEIEDILARMQASIADADTSPVFLLGDMNTASHLDWTAETADLHCGYTLKYPVTLAIEQAGLIDAYRRLYPDPRANPGNTWSPIYQTYVYPDGSPEPLDRIDMVHTAGAAVTVESASVFVVGTPAQYPNHQNNPWPSDHAAVLVNVSLAR